MLNNINIKVIYFYDPQDNRLTNIIFCGLCYIFINFLTEYEIDKKLFEIINFNVENEDKLLIEEEFRKAGLHIDGEFELATNFILQ